MRGLSGKQVLISAGSSGIGLAAAHRFQQEGASVFIAGLDRAEVAQAVAGLRAGADAGGLACDPGGLACDVSQEGDVARLVGGQYGIRVNALCPGYISTPLNAAIAAGIGGDEFEREYARQRIPLGRTGQPEEVAAAYAFLASDDASFIHGTGLVIDGGQLALM